MLRIHLKTLNHDLRATVIFIGPIKHWDYSQSVIDRGETNILNFSSVLLPVQGEANIVFSGVHIGDPISLQKI